MTGSPITTRSKHGVILFLACMIGATCYWFLFRPSLVPRVTIAVAIPLSGEDEISGRELANGVEMARIKNKVLGLLPFDHNLNIRIYDDESTTDGARQAAYKIVSDPNVVAVVGHFSSEDTLAALPIYRDAGLPVIMPVATRTSITRDGEYPNAFRMPPTNERQAQIAVAFTLDYLQGQEVYIIHDETKYARDLAGSIDAGLRTRSIEPVGMHEIERGVKTFPVLNQIANFNPPIEVVIFVGYSPEAVYLATQMSRTLGVAAKLLCTDGVYGTRFRTSSGSDEAFVIYQVPAVERLAPLPAWVDYEARFSERNPSDDPLSWSIWAFDGVLLAREAIEQAFQISRVPNPAVVQDVLRGSADDTPFLFTGALGRYEFDSAGDNKHASYYVYRVVEKEYEIMPWLPGRPDAARRETIEQE